MPMWTEEEEFLLQLRNTIFANVRKNDRVLRFYIEAVEVGENNDNK
jgi:hypothetical protein